MDWVLDMAMAMLQLQLSQLNPLLVTPTVLLYLLMNPQ